MAKKEPAVITAPYDKVREILDTGDIVLFSGKGGLSAGIKWFTGSKWSHVGMVLKISEWNTLLLWESTTLGNLPDLESGLARQGVQLLVLSDRLLKYDGSVTVRHLEVERTPEMLQSLQALRAEARGRPYEKSKLDLIRAAYDGPLGKNVEDLSSLFCSELVAEAYQRMGLLPEEDASDEYTPKDFSDEGDPALELLRGARLGKEILLKGES